MRYLILSLIGVLLLVAVQTKAKDADTSPLVCRVEIAERQDHFMLKLHLKNPTDADVVLEMGRGGVGRQVSPFLRCASMHVSPANFCSYGRAAMRPVPLTIPANGEVLYDTYFVGYPKATNGTQTLTATISFREFGNRQNKHELKATAELNIPKTNKAIDSDKK